MALRTSDEPHREPRAGLGHGQDVDVADGTHDGRESRNLVGLVRVVGHVPASHSDHGGVHGQWFLRAKEGEQIGPLIPGGAASGPGGGGFATGSFDRWSRATP